MDERRAVIVAISGCSSSGKTTLARLLRDMFPGSFILHEDDFYKPEAECVCPEPSRPPAILPLRPLSLTQTAPPAHSRPHPPTLGSPYETVSSTGTAQKQSPSQTWSKPLSTSAERALTR